MLNLEAECDVISQTDCEVSAGFTDTKFKNWGRKKKMKMISLGFYHCFL